MYKLLMFGAVVGLGVAMAKFFKKKKEEPTEPVVQQEQPAAA